MEVMAPATINALNGSSVKLSCTFNSCYKVENKQFSLNWTYQECRNCSEELVSPAGAGDVLRERSRDQLEAVVCILWGPYVCSCYPALCHREK